MAKVNKLALARLALRYCVKDLTREEKLCILTDMFCPLRDGVRWFGRTVSAWADWIRASTGT